MEEVYILSDGSQVDVSNFSDFEKISFLSKNPGAKKQKGVAKSAVVTSKKPQAQSTDSSSEDGSLESKKYRLPTENDFGTMQNRGILPPPSATPRSTANVKDLYGSKQNQDFEDLKKLLNPAVDKDFNKRVKNIATKKKTNVEDIYDLKANSIEHVNAEEETAKIKEKIRETDSELTHPYLYYSSKNQDSLKPIEEQTVEDDFVERNYKSKELEAFGINPQDFDGYLNKKGYKEDFKKKEAEGLFTGDGRSFGGYNIGLAIELARKKMLLMYMDEMKSRDVNRQNLNQDLEIAQGVRDKKDIINNDIFDPNGMAKYVENYFPTITKKLKDKDKENAKVYEESKKGGTDFFSWDTAEKIGRASWSAVIDRTAQMTASGYEALGMTGTAEGIRMLDEENKFIRRDDRGIGYVSGKTVNHDGTKYIVDSKGQIYDAEAKIRVTDLFNDTLQKKLVEEAKYGPSDWTFSTQGAAVQTSGVMADMLLQAAITRGVGKLGTVAGEIRYASNVAKPASGFTSLLNDSSKLLRKVPLDRATGYSMIAQGTMGYAQGYEDTLKAARDNGINDKDAFELASAAGQRMAVLYGTTGVINPQTKLVENLFGSKNIIKKAIEQYTKTGKTGFVNYIDDIIKNTPRNLVEFAEEGGKEVVQENIQQGGEIGVNMMTNKDAGKKIMNEVMSGDDFMNTSILSFISSGLISKAKLPNFHTGDQDTDNLSSLSTLAKNKKEFTKIIDGLVTKEVFTTDQVESLKKDVNIYANNVNKVPKNISPKGAMPIMRELDKVTKLQDEKETTDKAFHPQIDEKIDGIRENIAKIYFKDQMDLENKSIEAAIKKGVVKDIEMKNFSTSEDLKTYLVNELNVPERDAKEWAKEGGFALTSDVLKKYSENPDSIPEGYQIILQNEEVAFRLGDSGIQQHEFLHGLLQKTLKNSPQAQMLLGGTLGGELIKLNKSLIGKGSDERIMTKEFVDRLNTYADRSKKQKLSSLIDLEAGDITQEKYDADIARSEGVRWEEVLTLYSDALRLGYITYNESTFTKLGDTIRRVLQYLGIRDIKFDSGKDVYNFIKDYNASAKSGKWGKAFTKMGTKGANINKEALSKELGGNITRSQATATSGPKFSLGDRKSSEDIKKDVNKNYNKDVWSKDINSDRKTTLYDILTEYEYIIKGKAKGLGYFNLPDFSEYDFISETQIAMIPHIRNFNKEFLAKREEYKQELESKGLDPNSKEFKDKVQAQDEKGYQGKKGLVKENDDLNAWINSQLSNKMKDALKTGNVTTQKFTEDIEGEMFKESTIVDGFGGDSSYLADEGDSVYDAEQDFEEEQNRLAVLLSDPVFNFVDEQGKPIDIETVPFGSNFVTEVSDMSIAANKKLRTETDPVKIAELKRQLKDLERGLELQNKKDLTYEEKEELKSLKSFKSYDLSTGMNVNTFEALSIQDTPAKIITDEIAREILRSPNIETLEYRNFKERLSTMSKTMARRMTFKNGPEIESLMYREWQLLYDVINHPVDPVTNESSYASKKLPPRLKEFDEKGNLRKIGDITRTKFLQSYYGVEEATRIIKIYGGDNANKQIAKLEEPELNEKTGKGLVPTAYFDRRTALMELFGDVMVLQEARRLLRQPDFLDKVAERNVNLYNSLKDDVLRAEVLKDMSKGKSDIVKFSLAKAEDSPTTNPTEINIYNSLTVTGKALTEGIANNILFGYDSSPKFNDIIKFSLSELDENKSQLVTSLKDVNKKYENNFKTTSKTDDATRNKNYYIRTLQYSDLTDTMPGTKLHTFKTYEEVENEVTTRIKETFDSMIIYPRKIYNDNEYIDPDTGEIDKSFKNDSKINPFVIEDYRDGYIDTMLQKSIEKQDSRYIEYWTEVKNDPIFRKNEIESINRKQWLALNDVVETLYDGQLRYHNGKKIEPNELKSPNGLKFNPFFTYLFLKDILSSKYITNANTESSERKSFKKSEYKTTLAPVDTYIELIIKDVYDNFSDIKTPPGMVYSLLNIKYGKTFVEDWENNRKISKLDDVSIFKFKQSTNWNDVYSLNRLAANNTNPDGLWCTGQRVADARSQLEEGDFFIGANKEYKPIIAVRLDEGYTYGVGEVVGTGFDQACRVKDFPLISKIFLESDLEEKEKFANLFTVMHDIFVSNGENSFKDTSNKENQDLLKDAGRMAKEAFFRLELDKKDKTSLIKKLKIMKSNLIEKGLHTSTVDLGSFVVSASSNILDITKENIELLEEQIKITENELGVDESDEGSIDIQAVNEEGDIQDVHFELPLLEEISSVAFSGVTKFTAPSLTKGNVLLIKGTLETSFDGGYLELNSFIDFPVDIEVDLIEDGNNFMLSEKDIDFNSNILSIRTNFRISEDVIEEEGTSIDIAAAINTSMIELTGLAENVYLPSDIDELNIVTRTYKNSYIPNGTTFIGVKNINKLFLKVPVYEEAETFEVEVDGVKRSFSTNNFNVNNIGFQNENTSIGKTVFLVSEKPTDKFIQDILKSEIGLLSSAITIRGDIFRRDENGIGQYDDYVLNIKEPNQNQDIIKFSLAEENNGRLSNFLEGLPFSKQWLVARDIDNAIERAKTATYAETEETEKLNQKIEKETDKVKKKELKRQLQEIQGGKITFKVPSRSKMSDKSTAYFIIQKVAEGYNDFEFRVKKNAEGPLTKQVLDALDFKSDKVQERMRLNNNLEQGMNEIIEQNKGVEASETFSPETAKNLGKNIGKYDIYLPPEDEDFLGLLYTLGSGKGQQGQDQMDFLVDNLLKPYSEAMLNVMKSRQTMYKDWKDLINKKYKGISKELKQDSGYGGYLVDQAVRVFLWNSAGYEVPGLDKKDLWHLKELVRKDKRLRDFAQDVSLLSKQPNGYTEPDHNWGFGSVVGDINNVISKSNRTKYLGVWQTNVDKIFSKQNMSKIEALYGRKYSKALENMLYRMKTGSNRAEGASDGLLNWINGSTAVTMFWNTRSALLQVIGGVNYINTGDNNVVKAGLALLNIKQYTKDFLTIWNSDYLKDRRSGLMNDVAEAEFAQLMNDPRNNTLMDKFKAANYWFLKQGFTPTRVMDSFAIAFGGAGFYRNRINTYLKQGYSQDEAEKITMRDFYETSEISQQSADVSKISANQASTKGRLLLSFMNTPFQYSRIIKKSFIDIAKGRGSVPNNVAKIVYYSTIQNLMFNFLQNALFALLFDDDEEQKEGKYDQAKWRMLNGAMDTLIRGTGLTGVMLTTVKNALVKWYEKSGDPKGYGDVAAELANISPSIGIKLRSFIKAYKAVEYNAAEIEYEGFSLSNTYAIEALTSLTSLTFNLPADRMYQKMQNIKNALDDEYQTWQRVAFAMGYTEWNLGEGQSAPVKMDAKGTLKIPELKGSGGLVMPELK